MNSGSSMKVTAMPKLQEIRKSAFSLFEVKAFQRAVDIIKEHGLKNLVHVGAIGGTDGKKGLILRSEFPLNGQTAEAYLRAKEQILQILEDTQLDLFS